MILYLLGFGSGICASIAYCLICAAKDDNNSH